MRFTLSTARPRLVLALGCLGLALASPAWAQEEEDLPEVRAVYEAHEKALEAAAKALDGLESFGRESRAPLSPREARRRALERINGVRPQRQRRQRVDPKQAEAELQAVREALIARLRELDPQKYPEPEDPEPKPRGRVKLAIYDVADLVTAPPDFVAPTVGLVMGSGAVIDFDDDGEEMAYPVVGPEVLLELIEAELGEDESDHALEIRGGRLLVRHTKRGNALVQKVLERLRASRAGQLVIELRFYRLPREVFASFATSATSLSADDEARLAKAVASQRARLLSTHQVVAADGQRVVVRQGGSRAILGDLSVNQTGVVPVVDPEVRNVNEGLVVEMRAIADRAQQVVNLDMSLSRAALTKGGEVRKLSGFEVELPELSLTRTAASMIVPLGRGAFLAGSLAAQKGQDAVVAYARVRLAKEK